MSQDGNVYGELWEVARDMATTVPLSGQHRCEQRWEDTDSFSPGLGIVAEFAFTSEPAELLGVTFVVIDGVDRSELYVTSRASERHQSDPFAEWVLEAFKQWAKSNRVEESHVA